ncbi:MAG: hypothetical protein U5K38_04785 [Woeseiaceae bacterium]|nr:hypothetical protein [Woeseiaceae bacterium]
MFSEDALRDWHPPVGAKPDLIDVAPEVNMTVGKFRVLALEELIRQKQTMNRPKDRAVIELLEEVLRQRIG